MDGPRVQKSFVEWDDLYESVSFRTVRRVRRGIVQIRFNVRATATPGEAELWIQQEPFGTITHTVTRERRVFATDDEATAYAQQRVTRLIDDGWVPVDEP